LSVAKIRDIYLPYEKLFEGENMTIKTWPVAERPREKLLQYGAQQLSDAELLAIFLRTGIKGKTAVDLARDLLTEFKGLKNLFAASLPQFCAKPGIGATKYIQLQAMLELSRRYLLEEMQTAEVLSNSVVTKQYLLAQLGHLQKEVFVGVFLNSKNHIIASQELFHGSLNHTSIYPREVVVAVLRHNAASVIFAHNHPSGDPVPSKQDIMLTKILTETLALVDVRVLDHLVVGKDRVISVREYTLRD
jgi:DNA repair protein RadC